MLDREVGQWLGKDLSADARMGADGSGDRDSTDHRGGCDDLVARSGALPTEEATSGAGCGT